MAGLVLLATLASPCAGQWLEETIYLPDSLSGVQWPFSYAHDSDRNRVYISGGLGGIDFDGTDWGQEYWVIVVDAATSRKVGHIRVPGPVIDLCYNPATGWLYCQQEFDVSVIDCARDSIIASVPVGQHCRIPQLALNTRDNKVYCASDDSMGVVVIDGATNEMLAVVPTPAWVEGLVYAPTFNKVYCYMGSDLLVIDGAGDTATAVFDFYPHYVMDLCEVPTENKVYCLVSGETVHSIDGTNDSLVNSFPIRDGTIDLVYNPSNDRVYAANQGDYIGVVDCHGDSVLRWVPTPTYPIPGMLWVCPEAGRLYALPTREDPSGLRSVLVFDTRGDSVIDTLPVGNIPVTLGLDPVQRRIYCLNHESNDVTVLDCRGDSVVADFRVGSRPWELCYAHAENKVYCAGHSSEYVTVIDGATNRVVAVVPTGSYVYRMCYNSRQGKVYCTTHDETVVVIDCASDSVVARIAIGGLPIGLCYCPELDKMYCANQTRGNVKVIDCAADSIVGSVYVGGAPRYLCYNGVNRKVYCSTNVPAVVVIDCAADTVVGRLDLWGALLYVPALNKVYCAGVHVVAIDGETDSILAVLDTLVGAGWQAMCLNDRNHKVYLTAGSSSNRTSLMVVDAIVDTVISIIQSPAGAFMMRALCYNRTNNKVYVASTIPAQVSIVDGESNLVLGAVEVGYYPLALAWNPAQNRVYSASFYCSNVCVLRDSIAPAVSEQTVRGENPRGCATVVRRGMPLRSASKGLMLDITGRKVLDLIPGANDIRHVAPGVYFLRGRQSCRPRRLVVTE